MSRAPIGRLTADPRRFTFDAAVRILMAHRRRQSVDDAVRFEAAPSLGFPATEVTAMQPGQGAAPPVLTVALFGLAGPAGVLPRHYAEAVITGLRARSRGLHDFLGLIAQGLTASFAAAGIKYRPHRAADVASLRAADVASLQRQAASGPSPAAADGGAVGAALLALTGYAGAHLAGRLPAGVSPLQHYAGLFSARPRSADRLESLVSDWLGRPVVVEQFAGAWLPLPPDQRSSLATGLKRGTFSRLGEDAAIGVRAWDPQARIVLRVGPLDRETFDSLLPHRPALRRLVGLIRAFVGYEIDFAVNPVLAAASVPPLALGESARLGWNTWFPTPPSLRRRADAAEAVFEAGTVEGIGR